jgi:hypothetical protein
MNPKLPIEHEDGSCRGVSPSVLAPPIPQWGPSAAGVAGTSPRHPSSRAQSLIFSPLIFKEYKRIAMIPRFLPAILKLKKAIG